MSLLAVVPIVAAILIGYALGCVPGLNEHLHWTFWFVIPASGAMFGAGVAWVEFTLGRLLQVPVSRATIGLYVLGACAGYFATDFGIYQTAKLEIRGVDGIQDGTYPLADLVPFSDYMRAQLGSSSIGRGSGRPLLELGETATTLSYLIDLVGCGLVATGMLLALRASIPFCGRCSRYTKREKKFALRYSARKEAMTETFNQIAAACRARDVAGLMSLLVAIGKDQKDSNTALRIVVDKRRCPGCNELAIIGQAFRRNEGNKWKEVDELAFNISTDPAPATVLAQ